MGGFDTAMESRVHLTLEYSPPRFEMRRQIWTKCLEAIPPLELPINLKEEVYTLIRDNHDGREIFNAVNTARTLARFEEERMQVHHIQAVLQIRRDFGVSMNKKISILSAVESRIFGGSQ